MTIKMAITCSRCHREETLDLATLAEATALEEHQARKAATLKKLEAFLATLPPEDLPDFFAVLGEKTLVHSYLCDPPEEEKRSCAKRLGDLLGDIAERPERKPRAKKEAKPTVVAPK